MGLTIDYQDSQTPLEECEKVGLLIKTISTRGELDEHEQLNIEKVIIWVFKKHFESDKIFTISFIKKLHKKMFDNVWTWAGEFRKTDKNIGVLWINIPTELKLLLDDIIFWIENKTYSPDEIAIRFKHRLVSIHCFANGNGRHSRIMADIIIESIFHKAVFSWHHSKMHKPDETRKKYINALKDADKGIISPLIAFARG